MEAATVAPHHGAGNRVRRTPQDAKVQEARCGVGGGVALPPAFGGPQESRRYEENRLAACRATGRGVWGAVGERRPNVTLVLSFCFLTRTS